MKVPQCYIYIYVHVYIYICVCMGQGPRKQVLNPTCYVPEGRLVG